MKKKLFILITFSVAVISLITCSKEDNLTDNIPEEGKSTTLQLSLAGTQLSTKGTNALPSQATDNTINKIMVFVFNTSSQNIEQTKSATPAEVTAKVVNIPVTTGTRDIYVVINYTSADSTNLVGCSNVTDLKAVTANLQTENEGNFKMIGKKLNQTITTSTNNITVIVSRLVARVTLTNITTNFTGGLANKTFAIDSVYLLNVIGTKSYGDSTIIVSPPTVYNRTDAGFAFPIFDAYSTPVNVNNTIPYTTGRPNGNHFYVYSNPGNAFNTSTRLIITGMLNGTRTYYPIAINVAGNGHTPVTPGITANSQYSIAVTISAVGSTSPNTPVLSGTLTITVTPQNWATVINQNVSF